MLFIQFQLLPKVLNKGIKRPADNETYQPRKKRAKVTAPVDLENCGSIRGSRRLSARLRGQVGLTMKLAEFGCIHFPPPTSPVLHLLVELDAVLYDLVDSCIYH